MSLLQNYDRFIPSSSLGARVGHQFIGTASFPWHSTKSGDVIQDCTINMVVQAQKLPDSRVLVIEGEIKLDPNGHSGARRFQLDEYEIVVKVLHGQHTEAHPTECKLLTPESTPEYAPSTQITTSSGFTVNPTFSSLAQLQFVTSASKTYLGASIQANQQSRHDPSRGMVWARRVEDPGDKIQGQFLGTFISSYLGCPEDGGCSPDDPTTLSIMITAQLRDKKSGGPRKPLEQVLAVKYSHWPVDSFLAGINIKTQYDANTTGPELDILKMRQIKANGRALPPGITCNLSITRKLGSGFVMRVVSDCGCEGCRRCRCKGPGESDTTPI